MARQLQFKSKTTIPFRDHVLMWLAAVLATAITFAVPYLIHEVHVTITGKTVSPRFILLFVAVLTVHGYVRDFIRSRARRGEMKPERHQSHYSLPPYRGPAFKDCR